MCLVSFGKVAVFVVALVLVLWDMRERVDDDNAIFVVLYCVPQRVGVGVYTEIVYVQLYIVDGVHFKLIAKAVLEHEHNNRPIISQI